jgi:hypothetical protein
MKEPYGEGLASHTDPELASARPDPCGGRRVTGVPTATPSHKRRVTLP